MTRMVGRHVPPEMAALWLGELVLAFVVIYAMLVAPAALDLLGVSWTALDLHLANRAALLAVTIGAVAVAIGLYRPDICFDPRRVALNAAIVAVLAFPAALAIGGEFSGGLDRGYAAWLAKALLTWALCVLLTRWALSLALHQRLLARRILVLGSGEPAVRLRQALRSRRGALFQTGTLDGGTDVAQLSADELRRGRIWGVVIADPHLCPMAEARLVECKLRGVRVFDELGFCEQHLGRISLERIDSGWFIAADGFACGPVRHAAKRLIDIMISLVLLMLTLPLALVAMLAIRLGSSGPVLYRQERVGLHGRPFTLLKFRSMRVNAEAGGHPRWAAQRDARVTRVGAFIRSTRIDELPQLLNVLRGDMSLVGPRPERPHFVEQLAEVIPFYHQRSFVKPGITGWAQVNYPYGASVEDAREKLVYDLFYVKNRSLVLDLLILVATVRVILFREGAR